MERRAIVERLVVLDLFGGRIGPILCALREGDKVGDRIGRLFLEELASDPAHARVHHNCRAVGMDLCGGCGLWCIGKFSWLGGILCQSSGGKGYGEGGDGKRVRNSHAVFQGKSLGAGPASHRQRPCIVLP